MPPRSAPPTTSIVAKTIDVRAAATGPISKANFMAFQQLMVKLFTAHTAAINGMSSRTPPPPPASTTTSAAAFPYGMPGYGGIPPLPTTVAPKPPPTSFPSCHSTPSIADLCLGATGINHARIHPPNRLPTLPIPDPQLPRVCSSCTPSPCCGRHHHHPHFHKLSFPTFNGKDDPVGWLSWLNRCEHFFPWPAHS
jgi:hypothetical protein